VICSEYNYRLSLTEAPSPEKHISYWDGFQIIQQILPFNGKRIPHFKFNSDRRVN